ncbi:hypothetical protein KI387_023522, partial [Taxus chinensis]
VGSEIRLSIPSSRVPTARILPATATRDGAAAIFTGAAAANRVFGRMSSCSVLLLSAG